MRGIKHMKKTVIVIIILLTAVLVHQKAYAGEMTGLPDGQVYDLIIETVTFDLDNPGAEAVEAAVNEITVPLIGVRVHLLNIPIQQHAQRIGQMIANGEQLDLVTAGLTYPISSMAADGLIISIEELLDEYGSELKNLFGDEIKAGYIGNTLYGIPGRVNTAVAGGLMYNKAMAEKAGIIMPDPCSIDDLDDIFAAVQEKLPGVYGMAFIKRDVSLMNFIYEMESYGSGIYEFGVTFDPWNNMNIQNLYESDQYRKFCHKIRQWQVKGYIPPNIMTSTILPTDRLEAGQIFCMYTGYSPMQNAAQLANPDFDMVMTTEALTSTGFVQERMWSIPVTSKKPDKTMEFLNLLYTDTDLSNILMNGIEGVHYTRVSDHVIAHTDNMDYHRIFTFFGNEQHCDQWLPATEETVSAQIEFENSAMKTLTMGYTFDSSSVEKELEAVDEVIADYAPALECGMLEDVDGGLELFNQELRKAGIDRIIEENSRQLSLWISEQGH